MWIAEAAREHTIHTGHLQKTSPSQTVVVVQGFIVVVVDAILPKRSCQHARAIRRGEGAPEKCKSGDPSPAGG